MQSVYVWSEAAKVLLERVFSRKGVIGDPTSDELVELHALLTQAGNLISLAKEEIGVEYRDMNGVQLSRF